MRVVVVGLGHAGMMASSMLTGRVDLYAIEPNPYHQIIYRIHLVAAGIEDSSSVIIPIKEVLNDAKVINDYAYSINLNERAIYTRDRRIDYDYLIVSAGSETNYYDVDGARDNSYTLASVRDAVAINNAIKGIQKGSINIVGGGATGISLAGALGEVYGSRLRIRVIEALDNILSGWDNYIVEYAEDTLNGYGVELLKGKKVTAVKSNSITMEDGRVLDSSMTVWTAGIKARRIDFKEDVERDNAGRIVVDGYCRIKGYDDAFAIGDVSSFTIKGRKVQQSAQVAVRQGYQVAKNIINDMAGHGMKPIEYRESGRILSLGSTAVGVVNGIPLSGILCKYLDDFITYNYINAIKSHGNSTAVLAYEYDMLSSIMTTSNFMTYTLIKLLLGGISNIKDICTVDFSSTRSSMHPCLLNR
jgi:NADH dehydrogenase